MSIVPAIDLLLEPPHALEPHSSIVLATIDLQVLDELILIDALGVSTHAHEAVSWTGVICFNGAIGLGGDEASEKNRGKE
jgi:hypothetical protein